MPSKVTTHTAQTAITVKIQNLATDRNHPSTQARTKEEIKVQDYTFTGIDVDQMSNYMLITSKHFMIMTSMEFSQTARLRVLGIVRLDNKIINPIYNKQNHKTTFCHCL